METSINEADKIWHQVYAGASACAGKLAGAVDKRRADGRCFTSFASESTGLYAEGGREGTEADDAGASWRRGNGMHWELMEPPADTLPSSETGGAAAALAGAPAAAPAVAPAPVAAVAAPAQAPTPAVAAPAEVAAAPPAAPPAAPAPAPTPAVAAPAEVAAPPA